MLYREAWIEVNLDAIKANVDYFRKNNPNKQLIFVAKANCYGHGDSEVCKYLAESCQVNEFAVSSLDEALHLRNFLPKAQILILEYVNPCFIPIAIEKNLTLTIPSKEYIKTLPFNCSGLNVHIKVDTGMNRIGIKDNLQNCVDELLTRGINIKGVYSHFACSDEKDNELNKIQYARFKKTLENCSYQFEQVHIANTDGTFFEDDLCNAIRIGIGGYGYSSYHTLTPALALYANVVHVKQIDKGETVSYGAKYTALQDEWIATIPIGYADGLSRKNEGRLVYIDEYLPIVGRICMDQCMIRLNKPVEIGTKVEIIGPHCSLNQMANDLDTIIYEVLTQLSDRLPRIYYLANKQYHISRARFEIDN